LSQRPRDAIHAILYLQRQLSDPARRPARPLVDTTIDLGVQRIAADAVASAVTGLAARGAGNAAAIVLDRQSNAVRAWVGSSDYFDKTHRGAYDYTRVRRSPGSTLKPFIYALGLDRGVITPATMLDDVQRPRGDIVNADESFLGPLLPRVALANSRNVPAAAVLNGVGLDTGYAFLRDLGLHDGQRPAHDFGLGMSIGTLPVSLERLARAYGALARNGRVADLVWYDGQLLPPARAALTEDTARQITLFLSDPMARLPSFPRMGTIEYPFPVAIKTGTSSRYRDALTVAYSTRYVVAVWIGHPDQRPMNRLTAFTSAADIARAILTPLHQDQSGGLDDLPFPPPRDFRSQRICALSGKRATPACDQVLLEWFRPGEEPLEDCEAHVQRAVDTRDGLLASSLTPIEFVAVRRFAALPPRYAAWAAAARLPSAPTLLSPFDSPRPPAELGFAATTAAARISIIAPQDGVRLLRDPESPVSRATLSLRATVDPPAEQLVWYVDGAPYQVADYPYGARWPIKKGEHIFQARLPFSNSASATVRVTVE
jgi:penicillin-binding protein 1C